MSSSKHLHNLLFARVGNEQAHHLEVKLRDYCDHGPSNTFAVEEVEPPEDELEALVDLTDGALGEHNLKKVEELALYFDAKQLDAFIALLTEARDRRKAAAAAKLTDTTEHLRRERQAELNIAQGRPALSVKYGQVWDTEEMRSEFDVLGFMAPFVVVRRKADGVKGSLEFQHWPRYYFNFKEDK